MLEVLGPEGFSSDWGTSSSVMTLIRVESPVRGGADGGVTTRK